MIDACEWGRKKHIIHILADVDVTRARELIRDYKVRTGEAVSFTAFIVSCVGKTVTEDRLWHAYRRGRKLVLFQDVDIATLVEREVEGEKLATMYVIRNADAKSVREIHNEIRASQKERVEDSPGLYKWKLFLRLPAFLRRLFYWRLDRSPELRKRLGGTVTLSAVGMAGIGGGWGLPITTATLQITLGGIETKPGIVEGRIEPREYLSTTISFDHDIVDGVPAARFLSRLRQHIETAAGLSVDDLARVRTDEDERG